MYKDLGELLLQYASETRGTMVLVSPFIKTYVLDKILAAISPKIDVIVVTRWIPEEINVGVSDIDVWKIIDERPKSQLFLYQNLHAKYYRFDDVCLIGSANLTQQALGWKHKTNLELLLPYTFLNSSLIKFEEQLLLQSFSVTTEIYLEYKNLVEKLKSETPELIFTEESGFQPETLWIPSLRNPEELYLAYSFQWHRLTTTGRHIAKKELTYFKIPDRLSNETFNAYMALLIQQTLIFKVVDDHLDKPCRFGEIRAIINDFLKRENINLDAAYTWQTFMRWLLYFMPHRYSYKIFDYSEIFYRHTS